MQLGLENRRAVVAGASRGLGRAIALALAAEGARVTAVARNAEALQRLAAESRGGHPIVPQRCDLSQPEEIAGLERLLAEADILVLNSGGPPPCSAAAATDDDWMRHFSGLFLAAVRLARLALPGMRQRRHGRIIAIVSSGVLQPIPNLALSNALRLAVVGWARTLAQEVAGEGITVNCLAPGRIDTERVAELDAFDAKRQGIDAAEVRRRSAASIPAGRYGEPSEFAALATFLAGDQAGYMTGGVLRVDGGSIRGL